MPIRLLGTKLGMTQVYTQDGERVPVTVIEAGPLTVVQLKTRDRDGYDGVQLGYGERKPSFKSRPLAGHFRAAGIRPTRHLGESRLSGDEVGRYAVGQKVTVDMVFQAGDRVDVTGTSKGHGFTGVFKRHHFHGKPATHGTHEARRHGGSIGMHTEPGRVLKGLKMAGHDGAARVTVQSLEVVAVEPEKHLLLIRGAVPGAQRSLVAIETAAKKRRRPAAG